MQGRLWDTLRLFSKNRSAGLAGKLPRTNCAHAADDHLVHALRQLLRVKIASCLMHARKVKYADIGVAAGNQPPLAHKTEQVCRL